MSIKPLLLGTRVNWLLNNQTFYKLKSGLSPVMDLTPEVNKIRMVYRGILLHLVLIVRVDYN